jgi:hypothetical protein
MKTSKLKKRMFSGSCLTSKLYDEIIKMLSKSHETIPLKGQSHEKVGELRVRGVGLGPR